MRVLDDAMVSDLVPVDSKRVALVVDADRTLGSTDTGRLIGQDLAVNDGIRSVFEDRGYTPEAFLDVASIWGSIPEPSYLNAIERAAPNVTLHDGWLSLLPAVIDHVQVVVVTAGIPQIWAAVLARAGLQHIPVLGGCRVGTDDYVVCPDGKASLVRVLQDRGMHVTAAGDSVIDLPMLRCADAGFIVADHKGSPRLLDALAESPHTLRHFALDDRSFGLDRVTPDELRAQLLEAAC